MDESGAGARRLSAVSPGRWGGRLVILLLLGGLLGLSFLVLQDFLAPLLWAAILAYVTWPINTLLRRWLKARRGTVALAMTLFLSFAIVLPVMGVVVSLRQDLGEALDATRHTIETGALATPTWLRDIPGVGPRIGSFMDRIGENPEVLARWLADRGETLLGGAAGVFGVLARNAIKFVFALFAAFFFYRDGERWVNDLQVSLSCLLGAQSDDYWLAAAGMTRAVVYGLVLTAIAQGALAGLGYWVLGLPAPVLLGALTAMLALVPFGAPVVWGTLSIWLLLTGEVVSGIALFLWGALGISLVDNFVRPLVISVSTRISFLLVLMGVLGGLNAFGLVGLFLGPIVLAVLWAVWSQWHQQSRAACPPDRRLE